MRSTIGGEHVFEIEVRPEKIIERVLIFTPIQSPENGALLRGVGSCKWLSKLSKKLGSLCVRGLIGVFGGHFSGGHSIVNSFPSCHDSRIAESGRQLVKFKAPFVTSVPMAIAAVVVEEWLQRRIKRLCVPTEGQPTKEGRKTKRHHVPASNTAIARGPRKETSHQKRVVVGGIGLAGAAGSHFRDLPQPP